MTPEQLEKGIALNGDIKSKKQQIDKIQYLINNKVHIIKHDGDVLFNQEFGPMVLNMALIAAKQQLVKLEKEFIEL